MTQLEFDWTAVTMAELATMLRAGLVVAVGRTASGRVTSYALTPAGRALLGNQLARSEDNFPTLFSR